jgi:uncharacterized membrane protein YhaH (DUF805 family)
MPESKRLRIAGRIALLIGGALLLLSLTYPWIHISGSQPQVPAGNYGALEMVRLISSLTSVPLASPLYYWLFLVAAGAFVAAVAGRRARNLGTSGVLVIVLVGILAFLTTTLANSRNPLANSSLTADWGLVLALSAVIIVETGARLTKPTRVEAPEQVPVSSISPPDQPDQ